MTRSFLLIRQDSQSRVFSFSCSDFALCYPCLDITIQTEVVVEGEVVVVAVVLRREVASLRLREDFPDVVEELGNQRTEDWKKLKA